MKKVFTQANHDIQVKFLTLFIFISGLMLGIYSCEKEDQSEGNNADEELSQPDSLSYNADWTFLSHGKSGCNYTVVFPQDSLNRIEIIMSPQSWEQVKLNMNTIYGIEFGSKNQANANPNPDIEPGYVDVLLKYNGKSWKNVGYRLKGNSSLKSAWSMGNYKLPFRMNFDKFEDTFPGTKDQHFYGFKELTFSPGFKDPSLMREKLASEIFRMAGIPAANTAFYRVYIDFGAGLKYCGVYTCVEVPEDNMIKAQYGEENGNIYKPESRLSVFNPIQFEKKNNELTADYSDVKSFVTILNSSERLADASKWRSNLEAVFNTNHFLQYLAVNNAIVNWDSYGVMSHNYYLYNHSEKKLCWIPWDHNETFLGNPGITGTSGNQGGSPENKALSLSMNEVSSAWPLIRYLADDSVYYNRYKKNLKDFNLQILSGNKINTLIDKFYTMLKPYATAEQPGYTYLQGIAAFEGAPDGLKTHLQNRKNLIDSFN